MDPEPEIPPQKQSFWTTLPGILAQLAALIVALTGLFALFHRNNASDGSPTPTPSPTLTATPTATPPKNFITVVNIKNGPSTGGEYFDFDPADMDAALESKAWDHQYLWASQTIDGPRRKIWVVRGCSGSPTTVCGRYEPKGKPGDFYQNERLYVFWRPEG